MDLARRVIREPDIANPSQYRRRVRQLAVAYDLAFIFALVGIGLLLYFGRFFVTLSQRSNVETLTIAFFIVFFAYVALLTARGAWGGLCILYFHISARFSRDAASVEEKKVRTLGRRERGPALALNRVIQHSDRPGQPFEIVVADRAGSVGAIRVDGVKVFHLDALRAGSNDMLAFFVRQVAEVLALDPDELDVVSWGAIDQEGWHEYTGLVDALQTLGRRTGDMTPIWSHVTLTEKDCAALQERMALICSAVRDEAFLPQLEFEGEHKIPIIPEPLGIISLGRRERRVDPLASIGSSLVVILVVVVLLAFFILRPPWVPGK